MSAKGQNRPPALQHDRRHAYADVRLTFNHDAHPSTAVLKNSVITWRGRTTMAERCMHIFSYLKAVFVLLLTFVLTALFMLMLYGVQMLVSL
jgi:hypothetical protein